MGACPYRVSYPVSRLRIVALIGIRKLPVKQKKHFLDKAPRSPEFCEASFGKKPSPQKCRTTIDCLLNQTSALRLLLFALARSSKTSKIHTGQIGEMRISIVNLS